MKLDWVVNDDSYGETAVYSIPNGSIIGIPLTYCKMQTTEALFLAGSVPGSAFPDGEKQFVKAVVGDISFTPSAWAAGNAIDIICRITKKPQDLATAGAVTDPAYSLYLSRFANERYSWQNVYWDTFAAGAPFRTNLRVKATVNQWLEPDEALYLMVQNESGLTTTITIACYLRTLMKAEA